MQYEPVAKSVAVAISLNSEDYKRNPEIRNARRALLLVLSIQLV
jgi:hypothetical protein